MPSLPLCIAYDTSCRRPHGVVMVVALPLYAPWRIHGRAAYKAISYWFTFPPILRVFRYLYEELDMAYTTCYPNEFGLLATTSSSNMPSERSRFLDRHEWMLRPHKEDSRNGFVIERRTDRSDAIEGALSFTKGVTTHMFLPLTRLNLQLDSMRHLEDHPHSLYTLDPSPAHGFPNAATEREVVSLCAELGDRLLGLSISMCKPELVVPHIPLFVYEIVNSCPQLRYFGLEDVQCETFRDSQDADFMYLAAIALHDKRNTLQVVNVDSGLHTLVISKRSVVPWKECYSGIAARQPEGAQNSVVHHPYLYKPAHSPAYLQDEARELAAQMMRDFPSLHRAYVMLDEGELDLRMDNDKRFEQVEATKAYLADATHEASSAPNGDLFNCSLDLSQDMQWTDPTACPPPFGDVDSQQAALGYASQWFGVVQSSRL